MTTAPKRVLTVVQNELKKMPGDTVVLPIDIHAHRWLLAHRQALSPTRCVALPNQDVFELCDDKHRFALWAVEQSMPHPETVLLPAGRELEHPALPESTTGWIAKPRVGENAAGHVCHDDASEFCRKLATREKDYLVQRRIPGDDIDVSLFAIHGKIAAWTTQQRYEDRMSFIEAPPAFEIATHFVEASGFHGLAHLDLRREAQTGRYFLIEANPRCWGSLRYSTWIGVNFPALLAEHALSGQEPSAEQANAVGECPWLGASPKRLALHLVGSKHRPPYFEKRFEPAFRFQKADPLPELVKHVRNWLP